MTLSRSKNVLGLILEERNIGVRELERLSGVSRTTISNIVHGKSEPSIKNCQKIAYALKMRVEDIFRVATYDSNTLYDGASGMAYPSKQYSYAIKFYKNLVANIDLDKQHYELEIINTFALEQVGYKASKSTNEDVIAFAMQDSSMEDKIRKDDILFIDTTIKDIVDNKVYVFEYENVLYVRQLVQEASNQLRAKTFDSQKGILIEDAKDIHVFGKVIFVKPSNNLVSFF